MKQIEFLKHLLGTQAKEDLTTLQRCTTKLEKIYLKKFNINIGMRYTNTHLEAKWDDNEIIKAKLNDVTTTNSSLTTSIRTRIQDK